MLDQGNIERFVNYSVPPESRGFHFPMFTAFLTFSHTCANNGPMTCACLFYVVSIPPDVARGILYNLRQGAGLLAVDKIKKHLLGSLGPQ